MTEDNITIRGLTEGGDIPVKKFRGTLKEIVKDTNQYGTYVNLNFQVVEIIASDSPFELPIIPVRVKYSNRVKSKWGILAASMAKIIPETEDLNDQIDKEMLLEKTEGHMLYSRDSNEGKGGDIPMPAWEVTEIEGIGVADAGAGSAGTATDRAKELLDGSTLADFNKQALSDPKIRKDAALVKAITNKSFITGMVEAGIFELDENKVYHKV
jgi:hypothetical protein